MSISLTNLLFKDYRRRVLGLLLLHPGDRYHVREIARLTGTVAGTLHKELSKLAEAGVLLRESVGNQRLYQANVDCPIFDELVSILNKLSNEIETASQRKKPEMDRVVENNRARILELARDNGVRNVRVFGSMARNDAGPESDLDLLVELEQGRSGLALGGFLSDISDLVHRKVDVVTEKSLHPRIRDKVLREAVTL
ncbi:MAG: nucleotidyltransferase domain-containing protein [Granulosicoccus sp.]